MWLYSTPIFDDTDPLVCHEIRLRPSLWAVLFNELQLLGTSRFWEQVDPSAATVDDVISEINKATDEAVFAGCILIGSVTWLATACPDYALVCDGTTYLKVDYPELWAVIDAAYEVDEDNFRVPDLIARFPLGSSSYAVQGERMSIFSVWVRYLPTITLLLMLILLDSLLLRERFQPSLLPLLVLQVPPVVATLIITCRPMKHYYL